MLRILVLEDDATRIKEFKMILGAIGVPFTLFTDMSEVPADCPESYDLLLLDHDLGQRVYVDSSDDNSGYAFLTSSYGRNAAKNALVIVHSLNEVGARKMIFVARELGAKVYRLPYSRNMLNVVDAAVR